MHSAKAELSLRFNSPEGQEGCKVKDQNEDFVDAQKLVHLGVERLSCQIKELAVNSIYRTGHHRNGEAAEHQTAEINNAAPLEKAASQKNIHLGSYC
jgi:hypothetical protein